MSQVIRTNHTYFPGVSLRCLQIKSNGHWTVYSSFMKVICFFKTICTRTICIVYYRSVWCDFECIRMCAYVSHILSMTLNLLVLFHRADRVPGFLSSRPNWVPRLHHPQVSVAPPPWVPRGGGGHNLLRERGQG